MITEQNLQITAEKNDFPSVLFETFCNVGMFLSESLYR